MCPEKRNLGQTIDFLQDNVSRICACACGNKAMTPSHGARVVAVLRLEALTEPL